ncbi:hypothetical protein [Streptomyces tagetis]|uniref:Uncharacterized protein n=1 Tax=Streptomyces tagetis TaxID=2820809 RepID=A0A940XJ47_9ACTN|nr:hypothetical protein [Streptomyces sp. RG38]MBQ0829335.1 hypothetical protein [Streptomyces sp. RG38]
MPVCPWGPLTHTRRFLAAELAVVRSRRLGPPPVGQAYGTTELLPGTGTETHVVSHDDPGRRDLATGERGKLLRQAPREGP